MSSHRLTVGELRAEIVGWPDDAHLEAHVPDSVDSTEHAVIPILAAGYGPGVEAGSDPLLTTALPLQTGPSPSSRPAPRTLTDPYPDVLERALRHTAAGEHAAAADALEEISHQAPPARTGPRGPSVAATARVYARDSYTCRYCGARTILTPVMRLLARLYPETFPFHPNWKTAVTHAAFIARSASLDHIVPIAGGGAPTDEANLVTACWGCNRRKGDLTLEELGWALQPPALTTWCGLTELYEPAWIAAGRPELGANEMDWMRATRVA